MILKRTLFFKRAYAYRPTYHQLRCISSNGFNGKDIDDKLINEWKQGIEKREALKKNLADAERQKFVEEKKKELEESKRSIDDISAKLHLEPKVHEPVNPIDVKVSGSYEHLVNKIKENENFQQLKEELRKYHEKQHQETEEGKEAESHIKNNGNKELSERLKEKARELKNLIPIVLRIVNDLTGYTKVENLKQDIHAKEIQKTELRKALAQAKSDYNKSITLRSMSQKQINDLLQRQNAWSLEDLEKFTELYKNDHVLEKQEQENYKKLQEIEFKKDENDEKLTTSILTRYHEEQVWSDKIRKFSTWGTILIMGVNLFLFMVVQLIFEPLKRRRLVNSFELKVRDLLAEQEAELTNKPIKPKIIQELNPIPKAITKISNSVENEIESDQIKFQIPHFETGKLKDFIISLYQNISSNLLKLFGTDNHLLTIPKIQLEVLMGLSFLFSFSLGLLF